MESGALNRNEYTHIESGNLIFNAPHLYTIIRNEDGAEIGSIFFQSGSVKKHGINGITNEDLISIVIDRLSCFQEGRFRCSENENAIERLTEGLMWLNKRTQERCSRGVEDTSNL